MLDDPKYHNISQEVEDEMKDAVLAVRELKKLGARTTNKSAAMDYRAVLEEMNRMVSSHRCILSLYVYLPAALDCSPFLSHRRGDSCIRQSLQPRGHFRAELDLLGQRGTLCDGLLQDGDVGHHSLAGTVGLCEGKK